jgi:hypothetical protein
LASCRLKLSGYVTTITFVDFKIYVQDQSI